MTNVEAFLSFTRKVYLTQCIIFFKFNTVQYSLLVLMWISSSGPPLVVSSVSKIGVYDSISYSSEFSEGGGTQTGVVPRYVQCLGQPCEVRRHFENGSRKERGTGAPRAKRMQVEDTVEVMIARNVATGRYGPQDNLLWPYYREASRWHHSKNVRIVELQLLESLDPTLLLDKTSNEVCRAHSP